MPYHRTTAVPRIAPSSEPHGSRSPDGHLRSKSTRIYALCFVVPPQPAICAEFLLYPHLLPMLAIFRGASVFKVLFILAMNYVLAKVTDK